MTAHSDLESAVSSYQTGAFEYLPKPFDIDEALALVNRAILHITKLQQQESAKSAPTIQSTEIIGESPAMQEVFRAIGRLSQSHITVLINGESGTGKELVAHALHRHSPRSNKPFIALNMAAIPKDLIETELFGHEKVLLPVQIRNVKAVLNRPTAVRCSWMKLATCLLKHKRVYYVSLQMVNSIALVVTFRLKLMYVLWLQRIRTWKNWYMTAASVKTCITV